MDVDEEAMEKLVAEMGGLESPSKGAILDAAAIDRAKEAVRRSARKSVGGEKPSLEAPEKCAHPVDLLRLQEKNRYICECGQPVRQIRNSVLKRRKYLR